MLKDSDGEGGTWWEGNGASGRHMRLKGNPRKLSDPFLPGFSLSNVAFLTSK